MFRRVSADLGNDFNLHAIEEPTGIALKICKGHLPIGKAQLVTDNVDVSCITTIQIDDEFVNTIFNDGVTLGEIVLKFLIKFPTVVRKPEFRFILAVPDNLQSAISKRHFDRGEDSNLKNEILIRNSKLIPEKKSLPANIVFKDSIEEKELPDLLTLLKDNAYWQAHLTLERLQLLLVKSRCFFAFADSGKVVGFSRVVTDTTSFASLWDVVVAENQRGKGIGINLMFHVFTDEKLSGINNWILFTDTAKGLYQKFGFIPECEVPDRKLVHKLRLQDSPPSYMTELIRATSNGQPINLNPDQIFKFLFGVEGKRANLPTFWKAISPVNNSVSPGDDIKTPVPGYF
jgi:N-acetylglutamate synthase-like GNAT family acetyltransferase